MRKVISRYITLNPYNSNLKTPQTTFWLIGVGIVIFLIAFSEGFIWGNLFNFYFKENLSIYSRLPLCIGIGLIVFLLLWIIDTSFAMLDTSVSPNEIERKWYKSSEKVKLGAGVLTRVIVVAISLYTTIPAITKLSIADDIDKFIINSNLKERSKLIDTINTSYNKILDSLAKSKEKKGRDLVKEVGGTGESKRYGDKIVANVIRTQIRDDSLTIENTKKEREETLKFIQNAPADSLTSRYAAKYGVSFLSKTAGIINDIAKNLSTNDSYRQVEKISRVYVILLFIALVLLKIFAPRSVRIYLNEELQDLYIAYKKNQINSKYFANFKSEFDNKDVDITPYRFYEFWKFYYAKSRYNDIKNLSNDNELNTLDIKIGKLNQQKVDLEAELDPCEKEMLAETEILLSLEQEKNNIQIEIDKYTAKIEDIKSTIDQIRQSKEGIRPEDLITLSRQQTDLLKERDSFKLKLSEISVKIITKNKQIGFKEEQLKRINNQLVSIYSNLDTLIKLKQTLRETYMQGFT